MSLSKEQVSLIGLQLYKRIDILNKAVIGLTILLILAIIEIGHLNYLLYLN